MGAIMTISALAGKPAPKAMLVGLIRLEREYYAGQPDMGDPNQRVIFGTSGHRGLAWDPWPRSRSRRFRRRSILVRRPG